MMVANNNTSSLSDDINRNTSSSQHIATLFTHKHNVNVQGIKTLPTLDFLQFSTNNPLSNTANFAHAISLSLTPTCQKFLTLPWLSPSLFQVSAGTTAVQKVLDDFNQSNFDPTIFPFQLKTVEGFNNFAKAIAKQKTDRI